MRHLIFIIVILVSYTINAQDEYFINSGSSGDYNSISAAITDLEINGLSKDVVFYIEGEFTEQLDLTNNIANSDSYQIIFISVGDPDEAIIIYEATSASDNFLVNIAGEKVITFQNLTFIAKGKSYSRIINSDNPQGNLTFIGNEFHGNLSPGTNFAYNIVHLIADNSSENLNNIIFDGNQFYGGYHALYLDSFNSPKSTNLNINNNNYFESCFNGISIKDFDAPIIENNEFTQISSRIIFLEECINTFSIKKNKISTVDNGTTTGIEINLSNGTSSNRGIISNNFIQSNENGIVANNSDYIDFYFNTINIENNPISINSSSYAFSHDENSENLIVMNNIFNNYRDGYALIGNKVTTNNIDYNNFFTHGNFITNWNGNEDYTDLQTFQTSTSTNTNSFEEQVAFVSRTDLHIQSSPVDLDGLNISSISNDIDGDLRNNPPFIGADEYELPISGPLNGIYTIGISGDFETIVEAVDSLYSLGIDGAVTFNILNGTYNEQINLDGSITGTSSTNIVTFQSLSGNPNDVEIISNPATSTDNYVIRFKNVENIKVKNLSLSANNSVYARVAYFENNSDNIDLSGNIFNGAVLNLNSTLNSNRAIIGGTTSSFAHLHNNLTISDNIFNNGAYGIHLNFSYANSINNLVIDGNTISSISASIYVVNANGIIISNNTLTNYEFSNIFGAVIKVKDSDEVEIAGNIVTFLDNNISSSANAIVIDHVESNLSITGNKIISTSNGIRIYFLNFMANSLEYSEIINNLISAEGFGIYIESTHYLNLHFNTVVVNGWSGNKVNSRVLVISDYGTTSHVNIINNILYNLGDGSSGEGLAAISISDVATNIISDYNNLFSLNGAIGRANGTYWNTLAEFQASSGTDANSYNSTVSFVNDTTDLHVIGYSDLLLGTQIASITTDIDDEIRRIPPFIGADEPPPPLNGIYTIGTGGDYSTITNAVEDLYNLGINGSVTFKLLNGTFNEQINLDGSITGINPTSTVTFQSNSGNPGDVIISHTALSSEDNFVMKLNDVGFIKLKNLTLTAGGTDFSRIIQLLNKTNNLEFEGNILSRTQPITSNLFYDGAIILANENSNLDNSIITNNSIENGFYGIWIKSPSGDSTVNFEITSNTFLDNKISIYLREMDSPNILGNFIDGGRLVFNTIYKSINVESNYHLSVESGFEISNLTCSMGTRGKIANNFIKSGYTGIHLSSSEYVDIYFNTVVNYPSPYNDFASTSMKLYNSANSNINIMNNIFHNMDDGFAYHWETGTNIVSDFNNLYTNGDFIGEIGYTDIETFEDFITQTGAETNSFNEMVTFVSDSNMHISAVATPLLGTNISGISTDYDGDVRNNPPFIGADEPNFGTSTINLNVFLEGPYNSQNNNMNALISVSNSSPFSEYPKTVDEVPANVVDWVLVKLVSDNDQTNVVAAQSAFVLEDGSVVSTNGLSPISFTVDTGVSYYLVVTHRNHLSIMSSSTINFSD